MTLLSLGSLKFKSELFASPAASKRHTHQPREPLDIQIALIISPHRDGENHRRDDRGPDQLGPHAGQHRRAGIGTGSALAVLVLAAYAERQCQEQPDPPQHEVDRKRRGYGINTRRSPPFDSYARP